MNQINKRVTFYKNKSENNRNSLEFRFQIQYPAYILTYYCSVIQSVVNSSLVIRNRISFVTQTSTNTLLSKYPKDQYIPMMTAQTHDLVTIDLSTDITTANTIDTPLFVKNAESPPEPNDIIPKEPTPTTAEKNKKERKSEKMFVNLHSCDTNKNESTIMRTIEHGEEIVFKNNR